MLLVIIVMDFVLEKFSNHSKESLNDYICFCVSILGDAYYPIGEE